MVKEGEGQGRIQELSKAGGGGAFFPRPVLHFKKIQRAPGVPPPPGSAPEGVQIACRIAYVLNGKK